MVAILVILVMAAIKDGWQHIQVEDLPKLSGVQFLLQVPILNNRSIIAILWLLIMSAIQNVSQNEKLIKDGHQRSPHPKLDF